MARDMIDTEGHGASATPIQPHEGSARAAELTEACELSRFALEIDLTRNFMPLARSWRHALDQELVGLGLSGATGWTLLLIDQLGDGVRQTDLAAGLDINSASLVRLIDALVELGYADRLLDPIDRRVRRVRLSDRGREAAARVERMVATLRRRALAGLGDAEIATALRVARQIGRSLDEGRRL